MEESLKHEIVWEFRPKDGFFEKPDKVLRYDGGRWSKDDGEYDLAFIGTRSLESSFTPGLYQGGWPNSLYVDPGCSNMFCHWYTKSCYDVQPKHPDRNAWHRATLDGRRDLGAYVPWNHPNEMAARQSGSRAAKEFGCCSGTGIRFDWRDKHIAANLVRNRETKEVFVWPHEINCVYCGVPPWTTDAYSVG